MTDLISRKAAIDGKILIQRANGVEIYSDEAVPVEYLKRLPSAEPVRHGKWVVCDEIIAGIYHTVSECSKCGFTTDKMYRSEMLYCPRCGARMDAE